MTVSFEEKFKFDPIHAVEATDVNRNDVRATRWEGNKEILSTRTLLTLPYVNFDRQVKYGSEMDQRAHTYIFTTF